MSLVLVNGCSLDYADGIAYYSTFCCIGNVIAAHNTICDTGTLWRARFEIATVYSVQFQLLQWSLAARPCTFGCDVCSHYVVAHMLLLPNTYCWSSKRVTDGSSNISNSSADQRAHSRTNCSNRFPDQLGTDGTDSTNVFTNASAYADPNVCEWALCPLRHHAQVLLLVCAETWRSSSPSCAHWACVYVN
jgi:hypothetical protein